GALRRRARAAARAGRASPRRRRPAGHDEPGRAQSSRQSRGRAREGAAAGAGGAGAAARARGHADPHRRRAAPPRRQATSRGAEALADESFWMNSAVTLVPLTSVAATVTRSPRCRFFWISGPTFDMSTVSRRLSSACSVSVEPFTLTTRPWMFCQPWLVPEVAAVDVELEARYAELTGPPPGLAIQALPVRSKTKRP